MDTRSLTYVSEKSAGMFYAKFNMGPSAPFHLGLHAAVSCSQPSRDSGLHGSHRSMSPDYTSYSAAGIFLIAAAAASGDTKDTQSASALR